MAEDIDKAFADLRQAMKNEGHTSAGQMGLVLAFEMLINDMRRAADALEKVKPDPQSTG